MAQQKTGKGNKTLARSSRLAPKNASQRPGKVSRARRNHIKHARQSCGPEFAEKLELYYARVGNPGKKHRPRR